MLQLTIQSGDSGPQTVPLNGAGPFGIGRGNNNPVCIADGRISGQHGEISLRAGSYLYRDLRSTNGSLLIHRDEKTIVDGESQVEVALADGDVLLLGDVDNPIVVHVAITGEPLAVQAEGTVVAHRPLDGADDFQSILLEQVPQTGQRLLTLLRQIGGEADTAQVFQSVAGHLLDWIPAAQSVLMVPADNDQPVWRFARGATTTEEVSGDEPAYPRGLVEQSLADGEAILAEDDRTLDTERSLARFDAQDAVVAPLLHGAQRLGALVVLGSTGMGADALDRVAALAHQVASCFSMARVVRRLRGLERRLREENRYLRQQIERDEVFTDIIGQSRGIQDVLSKVQVVMGTDITVLVTGETGTGKELVARAIHDKGTRGKRLFAAVNCAALSENLLESELFGHVKGAFTGAVDNKKGLFQVADGGTLFLDEIGELSLPLQAKLLRVLQEGEVTPVGSTRPLSVDVRIVTATHRDLKTEVSEGRFREDLYYRINVFPIHIPPLRERRDDIPPLAQHFLDHYGHRFGKSIPGFSEEAMAALQAHPFPGNIRELENEVQRAVLLTTDGQPVDTTQLRDDVHEGGVGQSAGGDSVALCGTLKATMEAYERRVLRVALESNGWNRSQTARDLEISRQALMVKLSKYDLAPD